MISKNNIEFRKVRDFGGILGVTFEYVKQNFKSLFKANLLLSAPLILLAGVFLGIYQSSIFNFQFNQEFEQFGISFLLYLLFTMLSYLFITVVTYTHLTIYKNSGSGTIDIADIWKQVKSNLLMIFLTGIVCIIIIVTGFIFLIIPGIYFSITLSIIFIVRIEEKLSLVKAIRRCINLISGNWWFTFGLILVMGIIQGFLGFILYIPNYVVMMFLAFTGIDSSIGETGRIMFILSSIIASFGLLFYSLTIIAVAFQYYNLVERKEAPGLVSKIEELK